MRIYGALKCLHIIGRTAAVGRHFADECTLTMSNCLARQDQRALFVVGRKVRGQRRTVAQRSFLPKPISVVKPYLIIKGIRNHGALTTTFS